MIAHARCAECDWGCPPYEKGLNYGYGAAVMDPELGLRLEFGLGLGGSHVGSRSNRIRVRSRTRVRVEE